MTIATSAVIIDILSMLFLLVEIPAFIELITLEISKAQGLAFGISDALMRWLGIDGWCSKD
jgi:hypothetical protein